jgi:hypothetical protein
VTDIDRAGDKWLRATWKAPTGLVACDWYHAARRTIMANAIDEFIKAKVFPQYRPIVEKFRSLIKKEFPEIREEMRAGTEAYHGVPSYRVKRIVAVISPTQKGVTFAFSKGASFKDKYGLLEGVGKAAKNVRLSNVDDFNEDAMRYYIKQAVELDKK